MTCMNHSKLHDKFHCESPFILPGTSFTMMLCKVLASRHGLHHLFGQAELEKRDAPEDEAMDARDLVRIGNTIFLFDDVY